MAIIGTAEERREYDKDPNLMSKSQMMMLTRKKCQIPFKYRYEDGIEIEAEEDDQRTIGTASHDTIYKFLMNLSKVPFNINKHKDISAWVPRMRPEVEPLFGNFLYQYARVTKGEFDLLPLYSEVVAQEGTEIGTLDYVWEMDDGKFAVMEIKNSPFPTDLASIRIETAFYARLVGGSYIGAFFLKGSEKRPHGGFFFEPLTPRMEKRVQEHVDRAWEARRTKQYRRGPSVFCAWCDHVKLCRKECTPEEKKELSKQLKFGRRIRKEKEGKA